MRKAVIALAVLSLLAVFGSARADQAAPGGGSCLFAPEDLSVMMPASQSLASPLECQILATCRCRCVHRYHFCLRGGGSGCLEAFFDCDDACIAAHPEAAEECTEPVECG